VSSGEGRTDGHQDGGVTNELVSLVTPGPRTASAPVVEYTCVALDSALKSAFL
jgi:hypothetical protein